MFNVSDIITAGSDLVGWRDSANTDYTPLPSYLTTPQSYYYVNDLPAVDLDVVNQALSTDKTSVSEYLSQVHQGEIISLVDDFVNRSKSLLGSKSILSNFDVTNGHADVRDLATKNARFVGWVLHPRSSNNIRAQITKIGLQLDTAQMVRIYLYETSQQDAIKTAELQYTTPLSVQWFDITDWFVEYRGDYGTRQQYLLGYYEYDPNNIVSGQLVGNAVEYEFDCGCNNSPRRIYGEFVWVEPIEFENADLNLTGSDYQLPTFDDLESNLCDESRGLFAKINVTCDITDVIVDNITSFSKALQYKIAIRVLDDFLASKRLNSTVDSSRIREIVEDKRNMYFSVLYGWIDSTGMRRRGIIDDITIDFSSMDDVCLPCEQDSARVITIGRR